MRRFGFIAAAALVLSSCAAVSAIGVAHDLATTSVGQRFIVDDKAMYAAEALYNVPAQAYVSARKRDLVSPQLRATIKPMLQKLHGLLLDARAAYKLGNAQSFHDKMTAMTELRDRVLPLIPK